MYKIAAAHGISLDSLIAANPQICDPNLIYPGQVINIPEGRWAPGPPKPPPPGKPPCEPRPWEPDDPCHRPKPCPDKDPWPES